MLLYTLSRLMLGPEADATTLPSDFLPYGNSTDKTPRIPNDDLPFHTTVHSDRSHRQAPNSTRDQRISAHVTQKKWRDYSLRIVRKYIQQKQFSDF